MRDLRVDFAATFLQFGDPHLRIGLAPLAHLPEEFKQGEKTRLGADKGSFGQALELGQGLFRRRSQVKVRLVRPGRVEFTQPSSVVFSPVVQIALGCPRKGLGSQLLA